MKKQYNLKCNIAETLNIVGDKWALLILHELLVGHSTFKDIQVGLDGIPTNLLSDRLKRLENDGLIESRLYQSHPPRYEYILTESGADLKHVLNAFMIWGYKHLNSPYKKLIHTECGEPVTMQYYCNHCKTTIDQSETSSCQTTV